LPYYLILIIDKGASGFTMVRIITSLVAALNHSADFGFVDKNTFALKLKCRTVNIVNNK
jgi:hypothetical protein